MKSSSKQVRTLVLAGLALMIFAGACSRKNESTGQSNRGSTQTQGSDSATQYNTPSPNTTDQTNPNYNNNNTTPGAATDLQKDLADFRTQIDKKVADNAKAINDKRADLANVKSSMRAEYKKMLDDAEQRNNEIRDRVLNYSPTDKAAWDQFKTETNQALDDVSAGINKLDVK